MEVILKKIDAMTDGDLRYLERLTAVLLTGFAALLHLMFLQNAGALWRDEVRTLDIAAAPTFSGMIARLPFDSFPVLFPAVLRSWAQAFGPSDQSLRALGALIGLAALAALWWAARASRRGPPLISLALIGFSPLAVRTGDSLRAYGLGLGLLIVCMAAIWRDLEKPSRLGLAGACAAAILCAQCLYQNIFFILALLLPPGAYSLYLGKPEKARRLAVIGGAAAISLLPYPGIIRHGADRAEISRYSLSLDQILGGLARSQSGSGWAAGLVWLTLAGLCLWLLRKAWLDRPSEIDAPLYAASAAVSALAATLVFIALLGFTPLPRYYLACLAIAAVAADMITQELAAAPRARLGRLAAAALIAACAWTPASKMVSFRQTNMDVVAARLAGIDKDDLVIVNPYFYGQSFARYYRGPAPWTTLPPLEGADGLKQAMQDPQAVAALLAKIASVLQAGKRVWLVGTLPIVRPNIAPEPLPAAPLEGSGFNSAPYLVSWANQAGYFVQNHAKSGDFPNVLPAQAVSSDERVLLEVVYGWRGAKSAAAIPARVP